MLEELVAMDELELVAIIVELLDIGLEELEVTIGEDDAIVVLMGVEVEDGLWRLDDETTELGVDAVVVVFDLDEPRATYAPTPTATMITTITMTIATAAIAVFFLLKF